MDLCARSMTFSFDMARRLSPIWTTCLMRSNSGTPNVPRQRGREVLRRPKAREIRRLPVLAANFRLQTLSSPAATGSVTPSSAPGLLCKHRLGRSCSGRICRCRISCGFHAGIDRGGGDAYLLQNGQGVLDHDRGTDHQHDGIFGLNLGSFEDRGNKADSAFPGGV